MSDVLKVCPNPACKSKRVRVTLNFYAGTRFVWCAQCLMSGPHMPTEAEAKAAWNALPRVPVWSIERPTVVGLWWMRLREDGGDGIPHWISERDLKGSDEWFAAREFAGPMPTSMEAG